MVKLSEKEIADIFKALGDENRIKILKLISNGEKCACNLLEELSITQPTLSHHMKLLCDSKLVIGRKEGKWMHYSISAEGIFNLRLYLDEIDKAEKCKEKLSCKE